jgi:DNA mismatch repair protein MutL
MTELSAHPTARASLTLGANAAAAEGAPIVGGGFPEGTGLAHTFSLQATAPPVVSGSLEFDGSMAIYANAALPVVRSNGFVAGDACIPAILEEVDLTSELAPSLVTLTPLGQIRQSFILAVNHEGLWIIDQHVAHERVLFEKIVKQRAALQAESQRLLMPLIVELTPAQQAVFADISDELSKNGFEAEPFGTRSIAIKIAPAGIDASQVDNMLHELLEQLAQEDQALNLEKVRTRIAASIACHAAIKVNMRLEQNKMEWLLAELAKTECPMSCPHGRPIVLRYSMKDIQKAFKRI